MWSALRISLVAGALIAAFPSVTPAQQSDSPTLPKRLPGDTRPNKCFLSAEAAASPLCAPPAAHEPQVSEERALRAQIQADVTAAWMRSDFETLERMAEQFAAKRAKTLSGKWRLSLYARALAGAFAIEWPKEFNSTADAGCPCPSPDPARYAEADARWQVVAAKVDAWSARYPQSPIAINAKALYLIQRAWFYRGSALSQYVHKEAWPVFHSHIAHARELLQSSREVSTRSPLWFENMFSIAAVESWSDEALQALVRDFFAKGQNYPDSYQAVFDHLKPQWGGSFKAMDDFAREAAERTKSEEGAGLYTRLYWNVYSDYGTEIFRKTRLDWSTMRQGFEDIIARYPESRNLNAFALFSCLARDRASAGRAIQLMGEHVEPDLWQGVSLTLCQRAVRTGSWELG
jgi:hypothetical protein